MVQHGKIYSKHRLLSKTINFVQLETNRMREKSFIFQFLAAVAVCIHIFILGPCVKICLNTSDLELFLQDDNCDNSSCSLLPKIYTVMIQLSPRGVGGAYSKLDLEERGLFEGAGVIQKSGRYVAKGPKKRLQVLKKELDKMAIKLNHMKLDMGVIMQKIIPKNFL